MFGYQRFKKSVWFYGNALQLQEPKCKSRKYVKNKNLKISQNGLLFLNNSLKVIYLEESSLRDI